MTLLTAWPCHERGGQHPDDLPEPVDDGVNTRRSASADPYIVVLADFGDDEAPSVPRSSSDASSKNNDRYLDYGPTFIYVITPPPHHAISLYVPHNVAMTLITAWPCHERGGQHPDDLPEPVDDGVNTRRSASADPYIVVLADFGDDEAPSVPRSSSDASSKNNDRYLDYGPTFIYEITPPPPTTQYHSMFPTMLQ
ncbi:hypothetical protein QAD02_000406 [Eretmocerus hayati]|uniref:Uncharacterized protein n=1 Tax=Eretmocerus hayati TaxID=131215 RepID=A0ACC2NFY1_9HYME|nr:hypothetical protein QAD02_000406 [Eretmocerus hayati]